MLYFVPAWYQQNTWSENEQTWYVRRMHTEFDDTVKQIQLFHRSGAYPYQIMLLSFAPNFRHFLHRQGVYHAPYWSCFDAIQEIARKKTLMFSFHNLKWPDNIEFVYSPFVVIAMLHGEKYAQIEFGEDGNPIDIDMYENGFIRRRNIYDDRGFVSSTILYEEGQPVHQDYLNENGVWKLRHFLLDGHVEINPVNNNYLIRYPGNWQTIPFSQSRYDGMDQVIYEVLSAFLRETDGSDIFCVAMHERHAGVLERALANKKFILSFFEKRYDMEQHPRGADMVRNANHIITDSRENTDRISHVLGEQLANITDITPYDTRVDFGISQQLNVQKILVPVDGIGQEEFEEIVQLLAQHLSVNENARVHLFTRKADDKRRKELLEKTRVILEQSGLTSGWAVEKNVGCVAENLVDDYETEEIPQRFFVEQCVDELSVSKCMREQRVLVDLRTVPELYLQIACISMGIPQIVRTWTQYVKHRKNGIILSELDKLPEALEFYLHGLSNWNEAMVSAYEIGKQFTTARLIEKWKEVIRSVG
jgi:accessory secretory protein Asp1